MKKFKPIFYGFASVAAIVAPVAAVVSCGSSSSSSTTQPTQPKPAKVLPTPLPGMYSLDSFTSDAKKYNDNARWTGGLAYHSATSTMSFVRAIAEKYGYSTEKDNTTGLTPRERDLPTDQSSNIKAVYVRADGTTFGTPTAEQSKTIKSLSAFTQNQDPIKPNLDVYYAIMGDNGLNVTYKQFQEMHLESNVPTKPLYINNSTDKDGQIIKFDTTDPAYASDLRMDWFSMFDDQNKPGNTILQVHEYQTNVMYEYSLKGINDPYPKISATDFQNDFVPLIRDLIVRFFKLYSDVESTLKGLASSAIKDPHVFPEVQFLISKLAPKGQFVEDANFVKYLTELNDSGNIHWMAAKALYNGFDYTLANGLVAPFAVIKTDSKWVYQTNLKGLKDMPTFLDVLNWTRTNSFWKEVGATAPADVPSESDFSFLPLQTPDRAKDPSYFYTRLNYVATNPIEQNLKDNGYTDANIKSLQAYIDYLDNK